MENPLEKLDIAKNHHVQWENDETLGVSTGPWILGYEIHWIPIINNRIFVHAIDLMGTWLNIWYMIQFMIYDHRNPFPEDWTPTRNHGLGDGTTCLRPFGIWGLFISGSGYFVCVVTTYKFITGTRYCYATRFSICAWFVNVLIFPG